MKNLKSSIQVIITLSFCLFSLASLNAQHPNALMPPPPTTPVFADASQNTNAVKIRVNTIDIKVRVNGEFNHEGNYQGITKTSTSQNYRYTSNFEKELTSKIEALLLRELGKVTSFSKNKMVWNEIDEREIDDFEITLKSGKVKIQYGGTNEKVLQQIDILTKGICKITYQKNCD